jgi:hypothetical protein
MTPQAVEVGPDREDPEEFGRAHVEAAVVLAPQVAEYLEDVDAVLVVVADAVRRWRSYVELGADDVEPAGLALPLRQYVDRYADRVESAGEPEPDRRFDYERYLRRVWRDHLTRLRRSG